jgi:uncharacterized peroxidase-related enzyme
MSRLQQLNPESATGKVQTLFQSIKSNLGMVPNMMRLLGNSPAALEGYLQLNGSLAKGSLTGQQREQIALAVAEANGCDYCLAAHSTLGRMVGLTADQIRDSRQSVAVDSQTNTLLQFVHKVVEQRGQVDSHDVTSMKDAGFDDGQIAEAVVNVALSLLTNYFNIVADTVVDFPKAPPLAGAVAAN